MPSVNECKKCFAKAGKTWSTVAEMDLQEGMCPVVTGTEEYTCPKTGAPIKAEGKVHLV